MFSTFGLGAIASAFEEAAMFYTHTNGYFSSKQKHVAGEALAFIQGTGLEITLKVYGLGYDANQLRQTFFRIFHVKNSA